MTETPDIPTQERSFDDLTLAEMLRQLVRAPRSTLGALRAVITTRVRRPAPMVRVMSFNKGESISSTPSIPLLQVNQWALARFGLWMLAVLAGLIGCWAVATPTMVEGRLGLLSYVPLQDGLRWWVLALACGVLAEVAAWRSGDILDRPAWSSPSESMPFRWLAFGCAVPLLALSYLGQEDNRFSFLGVMGWILSVGMLCIAFWPRQVNPRIALAKLWTRIIRAPRQKPWVMVGLLAVMGIAGYMRFVGFDALPAEMTSDHIEKLMDAQRVADGARDIFFANNGGREPIHMYLVAMLGPLTGGLNFHTLKLASALESLLGVLVFYFLGRAVVGEDSRYADGFGLLFALLAAVGYWHLVVTRVSLRIMLTPLVTGLLLWALVRFVRWNRRGDALWAGLILGLGLYSYQALRLLPVLAGLAVLMGVIFVARTWRARAAYAMNLVVMAVVSFAIFVPLLRFANDYPDDFWRRASGRLLGENVICDYDNNGGCISRTPTLSERLDALGKNIPVLGENLARAFGMFTYRGDIAWFHNAPNYPVFDPLSGALLLSGLGASVIWSVRRRDIVPLFMVLALAVMLIPSASAIANPIENPSNTRASGAMPTAYLLAAFGLMGLIGGIGAVLPSRWRVPAGVIIAAGVAFLAAAQAQRVLFGPYDDYYQTSWAPQREAGEFMRGFVDSGGAWGNVYLLSYAHFLDYRGVAIEAGVTPGQFPNGDIAPSSLPQFLNGNLTRRTDDQWRLDPTRDVLIIYSANDPDTGDLLKSWFPAGYAQYYETRKDTPWIKPEPFWVFRVPAPGAEAIEALMTEG